MHQKLTRNAAAACIAACAALSGGCASRDVAFETSERGVTEFTLDNGLKVLVKEDHRAPISVVQMWYRVGANDEPDGLTGVSHALEHMMFKGTPRYPADRLTETIKREGGRYNAFTGTDYTAYYEVFEKSRMPISFDVESDRMVNLEFRKEDFEKEIEVVKEERRLRVEDQPKSRLYERLYATAFDASPRGRPVIGWMNDLDNMTLDDLKTWYRRWYAPNNAVLMVAGDVTPEEVHRLAVRHLGRLKPAPLAERKPRLEPRQYGERRVTLKIPAKRPYLGIGYRAPHVGQVGRPDETGEAWEPYALAVLRSALSGGGDSRFAKHLVRGRKIAQSARAGYGLYSRHDDLFTIFAEPVEGVGVAELEAAIEEEIEKIKREGVTTEELDRIKAKVYAQDVYSRDSVTRQAYTLAALEVIGAGWRAAYEFLGHVRRVTPEQVQMVAVKYLVPERRTVVVLDPQPMEVTAK